MSFRTPACLGLLFLFSLTACGSPQGKPCTAATDCGSAGQCVDGVCCASACEGLCVACSKAKTGEADGTCAPVLTGTDPESECAGDPATCRGDVCDGAGACAAATAQTVCRPSRGLCDAPESCDGQRAECPADRLAPTTVVCRASAGACDAEERCAGTSADCPADLKQPVTTVCRPSAGACDQAETCDAQRSDCPPDTFQSATVTCRSAAGPCDVAEQCSGASAACPADGFAAPTQTCRPSAGVCDVAEQCSGTAADCPNDERQPTTVVCRAAAGACDAEERCDGAVACPADEKQAAGAVCRAATGSCDVAESCSGSSDVCPADAVVAAGTACRAAAGVCDSAESCDGVQRECPPDAFLPATSTCRAAVGPCDAAELCPGNGADCPADAKRPTTFVCRASQGPCDAEELCGGGNDCPADAKQPATTVCRPAASTCDVAERCSGTANTCPGDAFALATTVCRPSTSSCDPLEQCTGNSSLCPADVAQPTSNCEPYACVNATTCRTTCTTDADCGPSRRSVCHLGACVTAKLAFVTSTIFMSAASLGGLTGADAQCQQHAVAAGLGGTWKVWGPGSDTRLAQPTVPIILTAGKRRVANNWADLVDGTLANPINATEAGTTLPGGSPLSINMQVFTGAFISGASGGLTCANFTSNTANGGVTLIGNYNQTNSAWTFSWQYPCTSPSRIYCFEQ